MAKFEDLDIAVARIMTEVKETGDQVKTLRDDIAALKEQLPGISEAELSERLEGYIATLTANADALDKLQDHPPKPEEPA